MYLMSKIPRQFEFSTKLRNIYDLMIYVYVYINHSIHNRSVLIYRRWIVLIYITTSLTILDSIKSCSYGCFLYANFVNFISKVFGFTMNNDKVYPRFPFPSLLFDFLKNTHSFQSFHWQCDESLCRRWDGFGGREMDGSSGSWVHLHRGWSQRMR